MIAVIFEVKPAEGKQVSYLETAAELKSLLETIPGFISIERFQSMTEPEKLLSLSFWEDEEALQQWRQNSEHRKAQTRGRNGVFSDYRLRVAHVIRDYGLTDRCEVPADSQAHFDNPDASRPDV